MSEVRNGVIAVPIDQYQYLVEKGLARLSEIERRAIFLSFWRLNSVEQVAMEMRLSLGSASRIIDRAVKKIQAVFIEHGHLKA